MQLDTKYHRAEIQAQTLADETGEPYFVCGSLIAPYVIPARQHGGETINRVVCPEQFRYRPTARAWRVGLRVR